MMEDKARPKTGAAGTATAETILHAFYPADTPLRRLLLKHSAQVRDKALAILARNPGLELPPDEVAMAAMLHDIGIGQCHAPSILCTGEQPYLAHGVVGAQMLRQYAAAHQMDLERFARVCERHTGSGLAANEIRAQKMPLPQQDFLPVTPLEKIICLADKFFSKSGDLAEKTLDQIRCEMNRFGTAPRARFDALAHEFMM